MATPLIKKNYLAMIRNAARGENNLFRNFYILLDGQERDALRDGALGCGTVASSILYLQNSTLEFLGKPRWISYVHANVPAVLNDMRSNGWHEIPHPREGAVLVWEKKTGADGAFHGHMGFSLGGGRAVSNDSNGDLVPREHDDTYGGTRAIESVWWHPELDDSFEHQSSERVEKL